MYTHFITGFLHQGSMKTGMFNQNDVNIVSESFSCSGEAFQHQQRTLKQPNLFNNICSHKINKKLQNTKLSANFWNPQWVFSYCLKINYYSESIASR